MRKKCAYCGAEIAGDDFYYCYNCGCMQPEMTEAAVRQPPLRITPLALTIPRSNRRRKLYVIALALTAALLTPFLPRIFNPMRAELESFAGFGAVAELWHPEKFERICALLPRDYAKRTLRIAFGQTDWADNDYPVEPFMEIHARIQASAKCSSNQKRAAAECYAVFLENALQDEGAQALLPLNRLTGFADLDTALAERASEWETPPELTFFLRFGLTDAAAQSYMDACFHAGAAVAAAKMQAMPQGAARAEFGRFLARWLADAKLDASALRLATRCYYQLHFAPVYALYAADPKGGISPGLETLDTDAAAVLATRYDPALDSRKRWAAGMPAIAWNKAELAIALACGDFYGDPALVRRDSILLAPNTYFGAADVPLRQAKWIDNPRQAAYLLVVTAADAQSGFWTETNNATGQRKQIPGFTRTLDFALLELATRRPAGVKRILCTPPAQIPQRAPGLFGQPIYGAMTPAQRAELGNWLDARLAAEG
jgi:hypothetical protein